MDKGILIFVETVVDSKITGKMIFGRIFLSWETKIETYCVTLFRLL